ncbi:MAG TPA: OmpA family protein [Bryobacteraceae bacterium]|jgi:chemotaxis protein MotB
MKPKYFEHPTHSRDRWMMSYLDVVTILLILFVAMAAKTLHSEPVAAAAVSPAPPVRQAELAPPTIESQLAEQHLDVRPDPRGVVVSLPQELLFPAGQDLIQEGALPAVAAIAEVLRKMPNRAVLVGHADATPIHTRRFHNNWDLAAARSLRLLELLSTRYGIEESRLSVESHGSLDPKTTEETSTGRSANRRVEILILNPQVSPRESSRF